ATQPPQEPPLQQLGVEPVGLGPAMLPRYRETGGMDHVRLDATRRKPTRQPEAVAAGFEGQRNPGDRATGPDRLIPPAMQQSKQPFWARLQLFAWLTLNTGKHAGNQPARVAQLDHGNDRAILVQGDEGSAQVVWLGHRGTPSIKCSDEVAMPRRPPHSVYRPPRIGPQRWARCACAFCLRITRGIWRLSAIERRTSCAGGRSGRRSAREVLPGSGAPRGTWSTEWVARCHRKGQGLSAIEPLSVSAPQR